MAAGMLQKWLHFAKKAPYQNHAAQHKNVLWVVKTFSVGNSCQFFMELQLEIRKLHILIQNLLFFRKLLYKV